MYETLEEEILHNDYLKVIALVSFSISTLFICIHLVVFLITVYSRTIMGKCFAMFCTSLLMGYFTFLGSIVLQGTDCACKIVAIAGHYVLLAQSAWLLVTSLESWKSIKTSKPQQEFENKYSWRFVFYSLFGWLEPAAIVALALYIEFYETSWPDSLKPQFSPSTCRFGQLKSFLLFFVTPMNVNLILNLFFLVTTQVKLRNLKNLKHYPREMADEFAYYLRLNLLACVIWIDGLVGEYTKNDVLIMVYVLMNAVLGMFIFLIITFNNKISTFIYYVDTLDNDSAPLARKSKNKDSDIYLSMSAVSNT